MDKKDYQEALEWLFKQTPNYQENGKKAYKPGLDNIKKLCDYWGNPQNKIKTIHIGGTNGKGSTSNMLASILQEAGYKVGIYNSPHLVEFTERVKINGEKADKEFVYQFIQKLKQIPEQILPSFFEFTTIMAFEYFYQNEVDFAIIEVGLGGRLDSTNIIIPLVSAITNVQLDHQDILGETLEEIAAEKAGIIKENVPIISGDENILVKNIIREKADAVGTEFIDATEVRTDLETDLKGNYQRKNIRVVLALVEALRKKNVSISDENIHDGLLHVQKNTGEILDKTVFSHADGLRIFEETQKLSLPLDAISEGVVYQLQSEQKSLYAQANPYLQFEHVSLNDLSDDVTYNKCVSAFDPSSIDRALPQISRELFERYEIFKSRDMLLEWSPKNVHKATGLAKLSQHLGLDSSQIMACGDEANDLSMIEWAGLGVAMQNAVPAVKAVANVITPMTNDEEAVAWAIEEYVLKEN